MFALALANVVAVSLAAWAVWVRRVSIGAPWDVGITVGVALYGLGSTLESPWPQMAAASFALTGKYYLLPVPIQLRGLDTDSRHLWTDVDRPGSPFDGMPGSGHR